MKTKLAQVTSLAVIFLSAPMQPMVANEAEVRLVNDSIYMHPGICSCGGGFDFTMYFSSVWTEMPSAANGEVAPLPQPAPYNHWTYLILEDISTFASTVYAELDVPLSGDANGNGTPDFFEPSQAVSAQTFGTYPVVWGPGYGQLILNWNRTAGALVGTCQLYMNDSILGMMGPFNHTFELAEYTGALTYVPGESSVTGTINLHRTGLPSAGMSGAIVLSKSIADPINLLTLAAGTWTNQGNAFYYEESSLTRNPSVPTTYRSDLRNPPGAWRSWRMSIVDTNDANANGIPDLSDTPIVPVPQAPTLAIALEADHLVLSVLGKVGRTYQLQQVTNLLGAPWVTTGSFVQTNSVYTLTVPVPA